MGINVRMIGDWPSDALHSHLIRRKVFCASNEFWLSRRVEPSLLMNSTAAIGLRRAPWVPVTRYRFLNS
jgi:hypothetical protein